MVTSKGIMKNAEYDDTIFYTAQCSCGYETHNHSIQLDYDNEIPDMITFMLYSKFDFHVWRDDRLEEGIVNSIKDLFSAFRNRIKYAFKVLFIGSFEWDEAFMFQGEKQVEDYIKALNEGLAKMKKAKAKPKIQKVKISTSMGGTKNGSNGKGK